MPTKKKQSFKRGKRKSKLIEPTQSQIPSQIDQENFNNLQLGLERAIKTFDENVQKLKDENENLIKRTQEEISETTVEIKNSEDELQHLNSEQDSLNEEASELSYQIHDLEVTLKNNNEELENLDGHAKHLRKLLKYQQCYKELKAANEQYSSALKSNPGAQEILAQLDQIDKRQNDLLSSLKLTLAARKSLDENKITIDQIELVLHVLQGFLDSNPWPNTVIEYSTKPIGFAKYELNKQTIKKNITVGGRNDYGGILDKLPSFGKKGTFGVLISQFDSNKFIIRQNFANRTTISFKDRNNIQASWLHIYSKPLLLAILKKAKQKFFPADQSFDYEELADSFLNHQSALRKALKNAYNVELSNLTTHLPDRDNRQMSKDSLLRQLNRSPQIKNTRNSVKKLQQQYNNICKSLGWNPNSPPDSDDSTDYVSRLEKINDQITAVKNEIAKNTKGIAVKSKRRKGIIDGNIDRDLAIENAGKILAGKRKELHNNNNKLYGLQRLQSSLTIDPSNFSRIAPPNPQRKNWSH